MRTQLLFAVITGTLMLVRPASAQPYTFVPLDVHCPASAEPWVPSTWNTTRSSLRTRVHQELLIWATAPPSSSKMA